MATCSTMARNPPAYAIATTARRCVSRRQPEERIVERAGTIAVITGGGRGFGKAFGAALAAEGATVALVDLDGAAAEEAASEIGERALPYAADVTDDVRM